MLFKHILALLIMSFSEVFNLSKLLGGGANMFAPPPPPGSTPLLCALSRGKHYALFLSMDSNRYLSVLTGAHYSHGNLFFSIPCSSPKVYFWHGLIGCIELTLDQQHILYDCMKKTNKHKIFRSVYMIWVRTLNDVQFGPKNDKIINFRFAKEDTF